MSEVRVNAVFAEPFRFFVVCAVHIVGNYADIAFFHYEVVGIRAVARVVHEIPDHHIQFLSFFNGWGGSLSEKFRSYAVFAVCLHVPFLELAYPASHSLVSGPHS